MKVRELFELADAAKPNDICDSVKMRWVNDIEGKVACEIMKKAPEEHMPLSGEDSELSVPDAYVRVYLLYLWAMIELSAGNYSAFTELNRAFESELAAFARYVIRSR
ncbi:MAG: hypothetical protein IJY39_03050 [Clostridia bacterium]|nr:hypothetical protein [Clostridia bacterium]